MNNNGIEIITIDQSRERPAIQRLGTDIVRPINPPKKAQSDSKPLSVRLRSF